MFGFHKRVEPKEGPRVSTRLCTDTYNGKYPTVGLYDCQDRKVWVCKPLSGQAIRTSHARLITGADNAIGTVWKDRFLCFWFYTPDTGEGYIQGYPIEWEEAHCPVTQSEDLKCGGGEDEIAQPERDVESDLDGRTAEMLLG